MAQGLDGDIASDGGAVRSGFFRDPEGSAVSPVEHVVCQLQRVHAPGLDRARLGLAEDAALDDGVPPEASLPALQHQELQGRSLIEELSQTDEVHIRDVRCTDPDTILRAADDDAATVRISQCSRPEDDVRAAAKQCDGSSQIRRWPMTTFAANIAAEVTVLQALIQDQLCGVARGVVDRRTCDGADLGVGADGWLRVFGRRYSDLGPDRPQAEVPTQHKLGGPSLRSGCKLRPSGPCERRSCSDKGAQDANDIVQEEEALGHDDRVVIFQTVEHDLGAAGRRHRALVTAELQGAPDFHGAHVQRGLVIPRELQAALHCDPIQLRRLDVKHHPLVALDDDVLILLR
mmetsp:Transcript_100705/g.323351  ORF Transcript_100705/g.323351 Transcript_100705/m.323351 type:complete len:346 (-) Transcript_100705:2381-3418(-)